VTVFYGVSLALTVGGARRHPVPDPGRDSRAVAGAISSPSRGRDLNDGVLELEMARSRLTRGS
jgi:hypothetical protein